MDSGNRGLRGRSARISSVIARDLGTAILAGRHKPGDLLDTEAEASLSLRVSRTAYREAMCILKAKGFIEVRPKTGTRVAPSERWNVLDIDVLQWMSHVRGGTNFMNRIFELRRAVELDVAALAAQRRSAAQLAIMRQVLLESNAAEATPRNISLRLQQFRSVLFSSTDNRYFEALGRILDAGVMSLDASSWNDGGTGAGLMKHTRKLFAAVSACDAVAARKAMASSLDYEWALLSRGSAGPG